MNRKCRLCGQDKNGVPFDEWVKNTFTDWDKLQSGEIICDDCLFWFNESSIELAQRTNKSRPQRMRNYSHFIMAGEWFPLSKGDKLQMQAILLEGPFPELAIIAESGQKHIAFRARHNPPGGLAGWAQFEEKSIWVEQDELRILLAIVENLYQIFSKTEIETGRYYANRMLKFGIEAWNDLEEKIRSLRGSAIFSLALFLAQRSEDGQGAIEESGEGIVDDDLARHPIRLQEPLQDDNLGPVRG